MSNTCVPWDETLLWSGSFKVLFDQLTGARLSFFGAGRQWRPFGCQTILHLLKIWNDSYNNFWRKKVNQIRSRVLETSILFTDTALSSPILYSHYLFSLLVILTSNSADKKCAFQNGMKESELNYGYLHNKLKANSVYFPACRGCYKEILSSAREYILLIKYLVDY